MLHSEMEEGLKDKINYVCDVQSVHVQSVANLYIEMGAGVWFQGFKVS